MRSKTESSPDSKINSVLLTKEEETAVVALSDLFLFNGPLDEDFTRIAKILISTRLTRPDLESLFRNDVAFLLYRNQLMIDGVWGGFDETWLFTEINKKRMQRHASAWVRFIDMIRALIRSKSYEDYWQRVRKEMELQAPASSSPPDQKSISGE